MSGRTANLPATRTQLTKDAKVSKRHSWLPRKPSQETEDPGEPESKAWIAGLRDHIPYDLSPIFRGERIPELWDEEADTFVYLFPRNLGRGPSIKTLSSLFSSSRSLTHLSRPDSRSNQDLEQRSMDARALDTATPNMSISDRDGYLSPPLSARGRSNSSTASSASMRLVYDFQDEDTEDRHLYMPLELESDLSKPNSRTDRKSVV